MPPKRKAAAAKKAPAKAVKRKEIIHIAKKDVAAAPVVVPSKAPTTTAVTKVAPMPAPQNATAAPTIVKKKKSEAVKALLHAQAQGPQDEAVVDDIIAPAAAAATTSRSLTHKLTRLLHAASMVCKLQRVQTGVPANRPSAMVMNDVTMEHVARSCDFMVNLNLIALLDVVFEKHVSVSWEGPENRAPIPKLRFSSTEVVSAEDLEKELAAQTINEDRLVKLQETTCAPAVAPQQPLTQAPPTPARNNAPGLGAPRSVPQTPIRPGGNALHQGVSSTSLLGSQMKSRPASALPPPASPLPIPRMNHRLLGDGEIGEATATTTANASGAITVLRQTARSQSLELPRELLDALPEHKAMAVIDALKYEQVAEETNVAKKINTSTDLEKLLTLYDLVRSVFGEKNNCVGGTRLVQILTRQGRFGEGQEVAERRLLQLTTFSESGITGKAPGIVGGGGGGNINVSPSAMIFYLDRSKANRKQLQVRIAESLAEVEKSE